MLVQIVKRTDGGGVLRCTRDDGSVTWQKQGRHAPFFALHDLTHFAVETTLGFRRGFFGLMAEGWDVEDTTGKGKRGPLPPEAGEAEQIVGLFSAESASGVIWSMDEFNEYASVMALRRLTGEEIARVKAKRSELFKQWFDLPPDGTLELTFPSPTRPPKQ
jgi:hypothetical protein